MNNTDLIIFSGQSNMEGESERLPEINDPVVGAAEYRFLTDELVLLLHPVGEHIGKDGRACAVYPDNLSKTLEASALLASSGDKANMVPFFCKTYVEATGRNVVAVHAAKGLADYVLDK